METPKEINDIKEEIAKAIREKYGMSVREFSTSKYAKKWFKKINPNTLEQCVTSQTISFKILQRLYKSLDLGTLERTRKRTVKTETSFFVVS